MSNTVKRPRLPEDVWKLLRSKGGPQSTEKGVRGYDRKNSKREMRKLLKEHF